MLIIFTTESLPHKHKIVIAGNHELSFGYYDGAINMVTLERLLDSNAVANFDAEVVNHKLFVLTLYLTRFMLPCNFSPPTDAGLKLFSSHFRYTFPVILYRW